MHLFFYSHREKHNISFLASRMLNRLGLSEVSGLSLSLTVML